MKEFALYKDDFVSKFGPPPMQICPKVFGSVAEQGTFLSSEVNIDDKDSLQRCLYGQENIYTVLKFLLQRFAAADLYHQRLLHNTVQHVPNKNRCKICCRTLYFSDIIRYHDVPSL